MACVTEDVLVALAAGALTGDSRMHAIAHAGECEWCRAILAELLKSGIKAAPHVGADESGEQPVAGELLPGDVLDGRYRLCEPLGVGAHGAVWAAIDTSADRPVAIKILRTGDESGKGALGRRLLREAEALRRLAHPNVVAILDAIWAGDRPALVMEHLRGASLDVVLRDAAVRASGEADARANPAVRKSGEADSRANPAVLGLDRVIALAQGITAALLAAHAAGIVHRDLKPANVFVCETGAIKILDFGLASFEAAGLFTTLLTERGMLIGTPAYMAPELLAGARANEPSADAWSLGAVLFECLTGEPPFGRGAFGKVFRQSRVRTPKLPPGLASARLTSAIDGLLALAPEARLSIQSFATIVRGETLS